MFVLSDGAPTWDDHDQVDVWVPGMHMGDPEAGGVYATASKELHYYGPFAHPGFLLRDVARMVRFRRVELHCFGFGEADPRLLQELARVSGGQATSLGR
ncbi:MAG: hypothetical protein M9894_34720 [Planctomycetes bacterium]|nr:hypothetical protein [Planctomycetota bacterium]